MREAIAAPLRLAGYGYVETPGFEDTALFERGVGESTDVVSKEMYTFDDKGGRSTHAAPGGHRAGAARGARADLHKGQPAGQALVLRARIFRYERPQAGRYRHFRQVGAEALGVTTRRWTPSSSRWPRRRTASLGLRRSGSC